MGKGSEPQRGPAGMVCPPATRPDIGNRAAPAAEAILPGNVRGEASRGSTAVPGLAPWRRPHGSATGCSPVRRGWVPSVSCLEDGKGSAVPPSETNLHQRPQLWEKSLPCRPSRAGRLYAALRGVPGSWCLLRGRGRPPALCALQLPGAGSPDRPVLGSTCLVPSDSAPAGGEFGRCSCSRFGEEGAPGCEVDSVLGSSLSSRLAYDVHSCVGPSFATCPEEAPEKLCPYQNFV